MKRHRKFTVEITSKGEKKSSKLVSGRSEGLTLQEAKEHAEAVFAGKNVIIKPG